MKKFEWLEPKNECEALEFSETLGEKCAILAGGTDLIVDFKKDNIQPQAVIDLKNVEEFCGIRKLPGGIGIGALVKVSELLENDIVKNDFPILQKAGEVMASPEIRNRATIGGNVCQASPAGDLLVALVGMEARVCLVSKKGGERTLLLKDFILGPRKTSLEKSTGEILKKILIDYPALPLSGFKKIGSRKSLAIAVVSAGISIVKTGDKINKAIISLGAVGSVPVRAERAEEILKQGPISPKRLEIIASIAAGETKPISDLRGGKDYRRKMVEVLVKTLLEELLFT